MTDDRAKRRVLFRHTLAAGAAVDGARTEEGIAALPRVARFAVLAVDRDVTATVAADVVTFAPDLVEAVAGWMAWPSDGWRNFATLLDRVAVETDRPDLRGFADIARFACMTLGEAAAHPDDVARVVACLQAVGEQTRRSVVPTTHASVVQQLAIGWITIMAGQGAGPAEDSAHYMARRIGRHQTVHVRAAVQEEEWAERERAEAERAAAEEEREQEERHGREAEEEAKAATPDGHVVVCPPVDVKATPKVRDIVKGHENVVGVALPLVPVPDLAAARASLLFEYPYAEQAIDGLLAPLVGRRFVRLPPTVLLGPPGAGKSRLVRRLAETLGLGLWRTDASRADGASFGGTDRRWYSAEPAHPFLAISRTKTANPLVLIDEIEKAGTRSDYGRFWDCLLGFLEIETASAYPDPALQLNLDLANVSYVATANSLTGLPAPVLDRLKVIEMPEPRAADLDLLLPAVLVDVAAEQGMDPRWFEPLDGDERGLVAGAWRGGSVRRLRACVAVVLRARERDWSRH